MDWNCVCIIDLKDAKDITEDVSVISRDSAHSRYRITFEKGSKEFNYGFNRIFYSDKPEDIDISSKLIFVKGKLQPKIKTIKRFGEWCKIRYFDDVLSTIRIKDVQLVDDKRIDCGISNIMDYLMEVSSSDDSRSFLQDIAAG